MMSFRNSFAALFLLFVTLIILVFLQRKEGNAYDVKTRVEARKRKITKKKYASQPLNSTVKENLRDALRKGDKFGHNSTNLLPNILHDISFIPYYEINWEKNTVFNSKSSKKALLASPKGLAYLGTLSLVRPKNKLDVVPEGVMAIKDGMYSTDRTHEYNVRGSYSETLGLFLLIGCDLYTDQEKLPGVSFEYDQNMNPDDVVSRFFATKYLRMNHLKMITAK